MHSAFSRMTSLLKKSIELSHFLLSYYTGIRDTGIRQTRIRGYEDAGIRRYGNSGYDDTRIRGYGPNTEIERVVFYHYVNKISHLKLAIFILVIKEISNTHVIVPLPAKSISINTKYVNNVKRCELYMIIIILNAFVHMITSFLIKYTSIKREEGIRGYACEKEQQAGDTVTQGCSDTR